MTQPIEVHSESTEGDIKCSARLSKTDCLQIQLIFEDIDKRTDIETPNEIDHHARLLSDLPHWLPRSPVELTLTDAVQPLSQYFLNDIDTYIGIASQREQALRERNASCVQYLQEKGIQLKENDSAIISDEGSRLLLTDLQSDPKDLLIIGSDFPPSSFSLTLARKAPCPVLHLRTPLQNPTERIVVLLATDGSDAATSAARCLPNLIRNNHLEVVLVTVQQPYYMDNAILSPYINMPAMEEAMRDNAELVLDMAGILLEESGIPVLDSVRLLGDPAVELLRLATEKIEPDLIVLGAHNRSALSNWLLGSVSQRLIHDAPYNLLIVR